MLSTIYLLALPLSLLVASTSAQCVTPGYVPCYPAGSNLGGIAPSDFGDSGLWDSLQSAASDPIQRKARRSPVLTDPIERRALGDRLAARQNALCCAPDPDKYCLLLTDGNIPFCYDTTTTRYVFSDESYGYISNGSYYAADGTFVDFQDGTYSMTDGETGTFAPATSAASVAPSQAPSATVPGTGPVASVANHAGSGGSATPVATPQASPSSSSSSSSSGGSGSGAQSQPAKNEGTGSRVAGTCAVIALAVGFLAFSIL